MWGIPEWAIGVGFIILAGSLGRGILGWFVPSEQLRGRKASRHDLGPMLDDVQRRLGELEDAQRRLGEGTDVQGRLSEIEERLDFAERLLAKQRDSERIGPAKS